MRENEIVRRINKGFNYKPYILKKNNIEIIHFIEKFAKYRMSDQFEASGAYEQLKWESLVLIYCELIHSFVDKQRKIYDEVKKFTQSNLDKERDKIILAGGIEHKIIIELRNAIHHYAIDFTMFSYNSDDSPKPFPSPNIAWANVKLNTELKDYVNKNYRGGGEKLIYLFNNHCKDFITISTKLNIMLLEKIISTKR